MWKEQQCPWAFFFFFLKLSSFICRKKSPYFQSSQKNGTFLDSKVVRLYLCFSVRDWIFVDVVNYIVEGVLSSNRSNLKVQWWKQTFYRRIFDERNDKCKLRESNSSTHVSRASGSGCHRTKTVVTPRGELKSVISYVSYVQAHTEWKNQLDCPIP